MRRCASSLGVLLAAALAGGCVERSFVVETNPPGALVLVNDRPLGAAPVDGTWEYYGKYRFTLVKEGFETRHIEEEIASPWYEYFPLDFFFENIWPFKIVDRRRFRYEMEPARLPDVNDILNRSENLRNHGRSLRSEAPVPAPAPGAAPAPPAPPAGAELGPPMPREP